MRGVMGIIVGRANCDVESEKIEILCKVYTYMCVCVCVCVCCIRIKQWVFSTVVSYSF